jgi:hypothetical protein
MQAKKIILIHFFLFLLLGISTQASAQTLSFAKFSIGETRIKLDQNEFSIKKNAPEIKAFFISESVQWIRDENNLLVPRSLMGLTINSPSPNVSIKYKNKLIIPIKKENEFYTEIYVDLFNPGEIDIYKNEVLLDKVTVESLGTKDAKSKQLIDYSCAPYQLSIEGIDSEYLSVGCKLEKTGSFFSQHPRLEITISSTNLKTLSGVRPPFTIYLTDNSPILFQVLNSKKEINTIKINAILPKKITRLKTALGLGPYIYQSEEGTASANSQYAPSFMIYGKFDLTESSSFKAFDAFLYSKSLFNNSGLYFSYDLAEVFDGRILINTLLGLQGLHYRYKTSSHTDFQILYPQGFEVVYKHVFGLTNRHLTYGMFLSTGTQNYTNSWLRFGGKVFYELNYINWEYNTKKISMVGLSIGFPFIEAF